MLGFYVGMHIFVYHTTYDRQNKDTSYLKRVSFSAPTLSIRFILS